MVGHFAEGDRREGSYHFLQPFSFPCLNPHSMQKICLTFSILESADLAPLISISEFESAIVTRYLSINFPIGNAGSSNNQFDQPHHIAHDWNTGISYYRIITIIV